MDRRTLLKGAGALAAAAALPACGRASSPDRPNILLVMTDQQFADAMSCVMGDEHLRTPNMDRLAAAGTRFTRAYCANPLCVPSRSSIFTGRYPHETGKQVNATAPQLDPFPNIGMVLRGAGYATGYFGKWHLPYPTRGAAEATGFDVMMTANNGVDRRIAPAAEAFLRAHADKRFFAVCSFVNPHNICEYARGETLPDGDVGKPVSLQACPPAPANLEKAHDQSDALQAVWEARLRAVRESDGKKMFAPLDTWTAADWRRYRWAYCRMVEMVDAELGRILATLDRLDLTEKTVIIFTSDHGDGLGAHRWAQKNMFYDEVARIPFIVSRQGATTPGVSDCLVNNGIDVMPTICDYAAAPVPSGCRGLSLRPIAEARKPAPRRYVVCATHFIQDPRPDGKPIDLKGRMLRTDRFKYYVFDQGRQPEMLIDMTNDPGEMKNLAQEPASADILQTHRKHLREYAAQTADKEAERMLPG
jgi:arylsulfatase A-like enzyme